MALNVYFVELSVGGFARDVGLHLHGDVARQHGQQQPLLLLVLLLRGQPGLDTLHQHTPC